MGRPSFLLVGLALVCTICGAEWDYSKFEAEWMEEEGMRLCEAGLETVIEKVRITEDTLHIIAEEYSKLSANKKYKGLWYEEWKARFEDQYFREVDSAKYAQAFC
jgi:hypothetical protein